MSRAGLTMNPKTSMVLLLVGRLVSIVTAGPPASGESLTHVSHMYVSSPVYDSVYLPMSICPLLSASSLCVFLRIHPSVCLNIFL